MNLFPIFRITNDRNTASVDGFLQVVALERAKLFLCIFLQLHVHRPTIDDAEKVRCPVYTHLLDFVPIAAG